MCLAPNAWMSCSRHRRRSACAPAPPSGRSTAICTSTRPMATCTGEARPAGCGSTWTIAARSCSTSRAWPGASRVLELEPRHIFGGDTEPARRLRAIVDPRRLAPQVELEIERRMRPARLPLVLVPQFVLAYDIITAREGTEGRPYEFHELAAWRRPWGVIPAARFARAIEQRYGVSRASTDRLRRVTAPPTGPPPLPPPAAAVAGAHRRPAVWRSGAPP